MFIIYKITNIINDDYYIGFKTTSNEHDFLNNGYYGGGTNIRKSHNIFVNKIIPLMDNNKLSEIYELIKHMIHL
jgi:hypothetical protein